MLKQRQRATMLARAKLQAKNLVQLDDGQWEYEGVAQYYAPFINDRLMEFRPGSFRKTIAEQVSAGRVRINDGHIHSVASALGTVIEAQDTKAGVEYLGRLSSAAGDVATKIREGHIDENSAELSIISEKSARVDASRIPAGAMIWGESAGDGTVEVRQVLEVVWFGLALTPASSQGVAALSSSYCMAPQGFPVVSRPWDADGARQRLERWAGLAAPGAGPNFSKMARGFLVNGPYRDGRPELLGQVVDIVEGQPVVVAAALEAALAEVRAHAHTRPEDVVECARTVGHYEERLEKEAPIVLSSPPARTAGQDEPTDEGPEANAGTAGTPTDEGEEEVAGRDKLLISLELRRKIAQAEAQRRRFANESSRSEDGAR